MSYEDIAARSRLSQNIRSNLAGIGQGYADTAFVKYQVARDQRRMRREDETYEQKRAVDERERTREQMGAAIVGSLSQGGTEKEQYERMLTVIKDKKYDGIDPTSTSAGRMFLPGLLGRDSVPQYSLDHYKSLGLTPGQSQQALERKHLGTTSPPIAGAMTPAEELEAKYRKAKTAAVNADDAESVEFWDGKLKQVGSVQDRRVMAEDRQDPLDVSIKAAEAAGHKIRKGAVIEDPGEKEYADLLNELEKKLPDMDLRSQYQINKAGFDKILSALRAGKTPDGKPFTIKDAIAFIRANQ